MKEQNNIEELFKKAFEGFEADPGTNVWANVQSGVQTGTASTTVASSAKMSVVTKAIIAIAIGGAAVSGYFILSNANTESSQSKIVKEEKPTNTITQKNETTVLPADNISEKETEEIPDQVTSSVKSDNNIQSEKNSLGKEASESNSVSQVVDTIKNVIHEIVSANDSNTSEASQKNITQIENKTNAKESYAPTTEPTQTKNPSEVVNNINTSEVNQVTTAEDDKRKAPYLYKPNGFSPNLDGLNDLFILESDEVDLIEVQIFSVSMNKVVYQAEGKSIEWDGTLQNGSIAPEGRYHFTAILHKDGKEYPERGTISLLLK